MSDTLPDVIINGDDYSDLNTLSGLAAGTALVISNKSTVRILLQISSTKPDAESLDGEILNVQPHRNSISVVTAGENTVWARALNNIEAPVSVQEGV